jgi:hypothetical protein
MKFPIDFEQKVKEPPQIDGRQYPYQISAKHLMDNFKFAALQVEPESGFTETISPSGTRTISGTTVNVLVVENGVFKTGDFLISGSLTEI